MEKGERPPINFTAGKRAIKANRINKALAENHGEGYAEIYKTGIEDWNLYDSPLSSFANTFYSIVPSKDWVKNTTPGRISKEYPENVFKSYIEKVFAGREKRNLTAVEFGGPGSKLFRGFAPNLFRETLGVCLKDIRDETKKGIDEENHHHVIEGNILDIQNKKVLEEVKKKLRTEKVDLIISRMALALDNINMDGAILNNLIIDWYNLLNENGLMFLQFMYYQDEFTDILIDEWISVMRMRFPQIDISMNRDSIRIYKGEGSPEKLPTATQLGVML